MALATIRVSLTEDSVHEIPVAQALVSMIEETSNVEVSYDPFSYLRRSSQTVRLAGIAGEVALGDEEIVRVVVRQSSFKKIAHKIDRMGDYKPEIVYERAGITEVDPTTTKRLRG